MDQGKKFKVRIVRYDQPISFVNEIAQEHDLRYSLASVDTDVRKKEKMIQLLAKSRFNINQGMLTKANVL